MNRDVDDELHGIMEEVSEDVGYRPEGDDGRRRRTGLEQRTGNRGLLLVAGGVGVLLVIILLMLLFGGEEGGKADERISALQTRVDQIEKKLAMVAGFEARLTEAEKQASLAQQSMAGVERQFNILEGKIEDLTKKGGTSQKKQGAVTTKAETPKKEEAKPAAQTTPEIHVVKKGETLYQISKKYGTSVGGLRQLNQLKPGQAIHPGQKLLISKGKSP
jgi:LysM repeat protein